MKFLAIALLVALLAACKTNITPEQQVNDVEVTAQVKAHLARDLGASTITNIGVNCTNGVVTLSGQVDTTEKKARAEAIARAVPKVARVINNLQTGTRQ